MTEKMGDTEEILCLLFVKPPLCKGRWHDEVVTEGLTIPQSKIKDFCQPPLHKGAFDAADETEFPLGQ